MITSHLSAYFLFHSTRYGSVRWQLIHEYVQKSTSTTFPLRLAIVSGELPIQLVSPASSGASCFPSYASSKGGVPWVVDTWILFEVWAVESCIDDFVGSDDFKIFCSSFVISKSPAESEPFSICLSNPVTIARPTSTNNTPKPRRNQPFGSADHLSFLMSRCPKIEIKRRIIPSPSAYAVRYATHSPKLTGSTVARMSEYVGEQLEKTGPSARPVSTAAKAPPFALVASSFSWLRRSNPVISATWVQILGKIVTIPKLITKIPEKYGKNDGGTPMSTVLTLMSRVKTTIEIMSEAAMRYGRHTPPLSEPPTMMGRSGSTHGARTVNIPERNEIKKSIICISDEMCLHTTPSN